MIRSSYSLCMCCLLIGCAPVPPEVVTGQIARVRALGDKALQVVVKLSKMALSA